MALGNVLSQILHNSQIKIKQFLDINSDEVHSTKLEKQNGEYTKCKEIMCTTSGKTWGCRKRWSREHSNI
jgi:hypothetical protein